jgi:hypothetical protein
MRREPGVVVTVTQQTIGQPIALKTTATLGTTASRTEFSKGPAHATVVMVGNNLYISGTPAGLSTLLRMPARVPERANGAPIEIAPSDPPYAALSTANALPALPAQLLPATDAVQVTPGPAQENGQKLRTLTWIAQATSSSPKVTHALIVRDSSTPLPVTSIISDASEREVTQFSYGGKPVNVTAPVGAAHYNALTKN